MMDSGLIGKIDKAKRYAEEPERIKFHTFKAIIQGNNSDKTVAYENGQWACDCNYFNNHGVCAHTMAFELLLEKMVIPGEHPDF